MSGWLELAIRYCIFHRWKTAIMVVCIFLTLFLPLVIKSLLDQFSLQIVARATATPYVVGAKGSGLDLTLHALYFKNAPRETATYGQWNELASSNRCLAIPLFCRFSARGFPIVATSQDYFPFRDLELDSGRGFALLGECIIGWDLARELKLGPGDQLLSDRENLLDIAGLYPLKMNVVGVLEKQNSADDRAVFVDVKTGWVIQGLGHGHVDLSKETDEGKFLSRDSDKVVASAAVLPFTEITDANRDSFHFHGDENTFPLTAILVIPADQRAADLLQADYDVANETSQMVQPLNVIQQLMNVVFKVKQFFDANALLVFVSTGLLLILVVLLSLKLRADEMLTMFKIGCSRSTIALLQLGELALVFLASGVLLLVGLWLTNMFAADIVEQLIVQSQ